MFTHERFTELAAEVNAYCAAHPLPDDAFLTRLAHWARENMPLSMAADIGAATLDQQLMSRGVKGCLECGYATDQAITHWARTGLRARADARIARRARELIAGMDTQTPGWRDELEACAANPVFDTFRALLAAVLAADATKGGLG